MVSKQAFNTLAYYNSLNTHRGINQPVFEATGFTASPEPTPPPHDNKSLIALDLLHLDKQAEVYALANGELEPDQEIPEQDPGLEPDIITPGPPVHLPEGVLLDMSRFAPNAAPLQTPHSQNGEQLKLVA